jgi:hypothetical protein
MQNEIIGRQDSDHCLPREMRSLFHWGLDFDEEKQAI